MTATMNHTEMLEAWEAWNDGIEDVVETLMSPTRVEIFDPLIGKPVSGTYSRMEYRGRAAPHFWADGGKLRVLPPHTFFKHIDPDNIVPDELRINALLLRSDPRPERYTSSPRRAADSPRT